MRQAKTGEVNKLECRVREATLTARKYQEELDVVYKDIEDDAKKYKDCNLKELVSS